MRLRERALDVGNVVPPQGTRGSVGRTHTALYQFYELFRKRLYGEGVT